MKKSISLLFMTRLATVPGGAEQLTAVLQRRGEFNFRQMEPEPWPGCCRLTVQGEALPDETVSLALYRLTHDHLGSYFVGSRLAWESTIEDNLVEIGRTNKHEMSVIHWAIQILPARLKTIWLNHSSGGLRLITKSDLPDIQTMPNFACNEKEGVVGRRMTAMFPDELEAVKTAFAHFSKPT